MNVLAVDVDYRSNSGFIAGILFSKARIEKEQFTYIVNGVEDYTSGQFYKRELPCILALINEHKIDVDCVIIDGFVYLENNKPGLGKHLHDSLNGTTKVIGVAKSPGNGDMTEYEVLRGRSSKPLYVTCEGIDLENAKLFIQTMEGPYRIPDILKQVDSLCRAIASH